MLNYTASLRSFSHSHSLFRRWSYLKILTMHLISLRYSVMCGAMVVAGGRRWWWWWRRCVFVVISAELMVMCAACMISSMQINRVHLNLLSRSRFVVCPFPCLFAVRNVCLRRTLNFVCVCCCCCCCRMRAAMRLRFTLFNFRNYIPISLARSIAHHMLFSIN